MISSVTNQTQEELLAEFDAAFGGLFLMPEKPVAYREEGKGRKDYNITEDGEVEGKDLDEYDLDESEDAFVISKGSHSEGDAGEIYLKKNRSTALPRSKTIIILPNEVNISKIKGDLGRLLGERYLLLLNSFYTRGLFKRYTEKVKEMRDGKKIVMTGKFGDFLRAHHIHILKRLGGEQYIRLINYGLEQRHLIKSPMEYERGHRSKQYRLNREFFPQMRQIRYELTVKAAIRARNVYMEKQKREFGLRGPVYRKIVKSIEGLTFDYSAAIKFVASLPDGKPKEHRKNAIEHLIIGTELWDVDPQGRIYTVMVALPRDIRRFLSYGNEQLHVVDVSSSQPVLHLLLYPTECEEKTRYKSIVESGNFLRFMNEKAGSPYDLSDPIQRKELKDFIFQEVFYAFHEPQEGTTKTFGVIFKREFPVLWEAINDRKYTEGGKQAGWLAKRMQEVEAIVIVEAVNQLKVKPYPLMGIHDAIVTTETGIADVREALRKTFNELQLNPKLATKGLES